MKDVIMESTQMDTLSWSDKARMAINHTLNAIIEDRKKFELLGLGTQAWSLLTEAAADLFNKPLAEVRQAFSRPLSANPDEGEAA